MVNEFLITLPMHEVDGAKADTAFYDFRDCRMSWDATECDRLCPNVVVWAYSFVWVPNEEITYHVIGEISDEVFVYLRLKYGARQGKPEF